MHVTNPSIVVRKSIHATTIVLCSECSDSYTENISEDDTPREVFDEDSDNDEMLSHLNPQERFVLKQIGNMIQGTFKIS